MRLWVREASAADAADFDEPTTTGSSSTSSSTSSSVAAPPPRHRDHAGSLTATAPAAPTATRTRSTTSAPRVCRGWTVVARQKIVPGATESSLTEEDVNAAASGPW